MTVDIRPYRPGDEEAIIALFAEAHPGREMTPAEWHWRFQANPAGPGCIMLGWDGPRLVSHYATMSRMILWGGVPNRTEQSVVTMTAPTHRGQRLFQRLGEATYRALEADGVCAVWGFPNAMIHRMRVRDLGWRDIGVVPFLRRSIESLVAGTEPLNGVFEIEPDDARVDALWRRCVDKMDVAAVSDGEYCRWRFAGPRGEAYCFLALPAADGALEALAVWKSYRTEAQVVLFLAVDASAAKAMLEAVISDARRRNHRSVALWCNLSDPNHHELERLGFTLDAPLTYLGWRGLRTKDQCDVRMERLLIQMHDSDVF